jgi:hypothetical protein
MLQSRGTQCDNARLETIHAHLMLEDARKQIKAAMERAAEAEEDAGFWGDISEIFGGDIACIAEVVAAAALVIASGPGAPAILAGIAAGLSVGSEAGEKLGLDPKICLLLGVSAAIVGVAAGRLTAPAGLWADVARGAQVTQGVAVASGGGATVVSTQYEGDAADAQADATSARGGQSDAQLRFDLALEAMQRAVRDIQRAESSAASTVKSESDGRLAILARMGAA